MNTPHFVGVSNTAESEKDLWRTPKVLFDTLDLEFNFGLDVCASKDNALCKRYYDKDNSALGKSWAGAAAFINPPYSQTAVFMREAALQSIKFGTTVVALVNANTDTKWFAEAIQTASEIRLISGRINFIADGRKSSGNTKGQCIIIWRPPKNQPCRISVVARDDLMREPEE